METKTSPNEFTRRQFYLPADMTAFLRETAYRLNVSQACLIRTAVRAWAATHYPKVKLAPEPK